MLYTFEFTLFSLNPPSIVSFAEDLVLPDKAGGVVVQFHVTSAAPQAVGVPGFITNFKDKLLLNNKPTTRTERLCYICWLQLH